MGTGKLGALGTKVEYQNTSWVAPAKGGVIVANQGQGLISYIDFRGADKLHELQNLTRPVMIGEAYDRQGMSHWYAACAGGFGPESWPSTPMPSEKTLLLLSMLGSTTSTIMVSTN